MKRCRAREAIFVRHISGLLGQHEGARAIALLGEACQQCFDMVLIDDGAFGDSLLLGVDVLVQEGGEPGRIGGREQSGVLQLALLVAIQLVLASR